MTGRKRGWIAAATSGAVLAGFGVGMLEVGKTEQRHACVDSWQNQKLVGQVVLTSEQAQLFNSGSGSDPQVLKIENKLGQMVGGKGAVNMEVIGIGRPDAGVTEAQKSGNAFNLGVYATSQTIADNLMQLYRLPDNGAISLISYHGGSYISGTEIINVWTPKGCAS